MNEKQKNDKPRINNISFLLLWLILSVGLSLLNNEVFHWLAEWLRQIIGETAFSESFSRIGMIAGLILGTLLAPTEKFLLRLRYGLWIKGWISSRMLGIFLSLMPYLLLQPYNLEQFVMNNPQNILQIILIATLSTVPQVWLLRRYVQNSSHYFIGAIIRTLIPIGLVSMLAGTSLGAILTLGLSSAVMALTMLWLFSHPVSEEKVKREEAEGHVRLEDTLVDTEAEFEEHKQVYENQLD